MSPRPTPSTRSRSSAISPASHHTGELDDVTLGVKDVVAVAGVPMQRDSTVMNGFVPHRQ